MLVLGETWCFCNGGGKSERIKGSIFTSKSSAMASVGGGTGFLIHRNLLLTTHLNLPSLAVAEEAEIRLQDNVPARLVPHRFFITSSVLDLTIVGLDTIDGDSSAHSPQPHYLKTCSNPTLGLGRVVYLLGHSEKREWAMGEGKVVIATDNLIKLSTDGMMCSPGSAGFDVQGNLAFMVCDPMKLASSPTAKSCSNSSLSSSSWKKDESMQFGIPIPIIFDWLNQHWEGSLDELSKPRLPLIRLMSTGQKSEHSCASFTQRRVFKLTEGENEVTPSSSHIISRPRTRPNYSASANICQGVPVSNVCISFREQGIPTPEIYESPRLIEVPVGKQESNNTQLLDINFPPRAPKTIILPLPIKRLLPNSDENVVVAPLSTLRVKDGPANAGSEDGSVSTGSVNGDQFEAQSVPSEVGSSRFQNEGDGFLADYSSEGETMYSAETMESRNYTSPREERYQLVGRTQSCVSYNRWGAATYGNRVAGKAVLEKQQSLIQARKTYSQGASSQRSHDYFSPTVSSIMKKRNNMEQVTRPRPEQITRPRQSTTRLSPRWV